MILYSIKIKKHRKSPIECLADPKDLTNNLHKNKKVNIKKDENEKKIVKKIKIEK